MKLLNEMRNLFLKHPKDLSTWRLFWALRIFHTLRGILCLVDWTSREELTYDWFGRESFSRAVAESANGTFEGYPVTETNSEFPLKNLWLEDEIRISFWGPPFFQVLCLLVSERATYLIPIGSMGLVYLPKLIPQTSSKNVGNYTVVAGILQVCT